MDKLEFDESIFKYDECKLLFREPYRLNSYITISQPTMQDIINFGEQEYYQMIGLLCGTPSDFKVMLWDNGQDWNKISEFDFFCVFATSLTPDKTGILFGDLDFSKFRLATKNETGETVLYNEELDFAIDSFIYHHMISYVRRINGMTYTGTKIIKGATAKKLVIERDRNRMKAQANKTYESQLVNLISAMLVYPGFKYSKDQLKECGIYEFMDAVKRSQIYTSTIALTQGAYSGFMDTKNIKQESFNWLRSTDQT